MYRSEESISTDVVWWGQLIKILLGGTRFILAPIQKGKNREKQSKWGWGVVEQGGNGWNGVGEGGSSQNHLEIPGLVSFLMQRSDLPAHMVLAAKYTSVAPYPWGFNSKTLHCKWNHGYGWMPHPHLLELRESLLPSLEERHLRLWFPYISPYFMKH